MRLPSAAGLFAQPDPTRPYTARLTREMISEALQRVANVPLPRVIVLHGLSPRGMVRVRRAFRLHEQCYAREVARLREGQP